MSGAEANGTAASVSPAGLPKAAARLTPARRLYVHGLLVVLVVLALLVALLFGEASLSLGRALFDARSTDRDLLLSLRLPRALLALCVGAALSAAGATLQGLMRNPLADPFVLGVSGGAALGASLALVGGLGTLAAGSGVAGLELSGPALFAFVGAVGASLIVFGASRGAPYAALLTGVIFNAFALAAITFLRALAAPDRMTELVYWLSGSLGYEAPGTLAALALLEGVALWGMVRLSGALNLLSLGDDEAAALGVHVTRVRLWLLLLASLAVAGAVSLTGLIGFIGLLVPQLCRLWLGPDARLLVPASALGGAAFLCLADTAARCLFRFFHAEPPVGVLTALLGGPTFLLLLRRREAFVRSGV